MVETVETVEIPWLSSRTSLPHFKAIAISLFWACPSWRGRMIPHVMNVWEGWCRLFSHHGDLPPKKSKMEGQKLGRDVSGWKYCQSISASKIYMFLLQWRQLIPFGTCWGAEGFLGLDSQPFLNRGIQTKAIYRQMLSCIARFWIGYV
jgi:hypothetical protein